MLAAGAVNAYFGHPEIAERSLGLNDLPEALQLRNAILARFEAAAWADDPGERARLLSFAVVGGGPTGTEFAGALAELVAGTLTRDFPGLDASEVSITLAEATGRPLSVFPGPLPAAAERALQRKGVKVRSGAMVAEVSNTGLRLKDGTTVPAATVVWAAGVRAAYLADSLGLRVGSHERIAVTDEGLNILKNANTGTARRQADAETAPLEEAEYYQYDIDLAEVSEVWRRDHILAA